MSDQLSRSTNLEKPGSSDTIIGETMTRVYRISKGPAVRDILDSVETLAAFAREHGPGRYDVDEHSLDPFPGTKVSAGAWGKVILQADGPAVLDPIPCQE